MALNRRVFLVRFHRDGRKVLNMIPRNGLILALAVGLVSNLAGEVKRYFKGNTHAHSFWSDGNDFPEMVVDYYHRSGYDFAVVSDHDVMAKGYRWMSVRDINARQMAEGPGAIEKCIARFGADWIEWREIEGTKGIVLKPLVEFREQFEAPGEFLILEAEEISNTSSSGPIHINALNLEREIGHVNRPDWSTETVIREALQAVKRQEEEIGRPILTHLNHPNYLWAVTAEDIAAVVEEQFFEVYNGHPKINHMGDETRPGDEKIWDIANAIRIEKMGEAPLYAVATDDSHWYHGGGVSPGRGWIMVAAESLESDALIVAMRAGDFYASSGVTLNEISYDKVSRTIEIEIAEDGDAVFESRLIGTRRGYEKAKGKGGIGEVFATKTGKRVQFTVPGNALYARVLITSSTDHPNPSFDDQKQKAWTQPVGWK